MPITQIEAFPQKPKRFPVYQKYDFNRDLIRPPAREAIQAFVDGLGDEKQARRYGRCRQTTFLTECQAHGDPRCGAHSHGGKMRGIYISQESCKARYCEPCAKAFGLRIRRKLKPFAQSLVGESDRLGMKFITFTWKQGDYEIGPTWIKKSMAQVSKVIKKFFIKKIKGSPAVGGAIAVLEVSPRGFFHVHCLAYGPYVPVEKLREYWHKITGDSFIVDIRDAEDRRDRDNKKIVVNAVDEVLKYIIKPITFKCPECDSVIDPSTPVCPHCFTSIKIDQHDLLDVMFRYITAIRGRRRIHTWGIFYNSKILKDVRIKAVCPFCGSPLKHFTDDCIDDGSYWPVWMLLRSRGAPDSEPLPARYA